MRPLKLHEERPGVWVGQARDKDQRYYVQVPRHGEPPVKDEADAYRRGYEQLEHKRTVSRTSDDQTLGAYFDHWLADKATKWAPGTLVTQRSRCVILAKELGTRVSRVGDLTPAHVQGMKSRMLARGMSNTMTASYLHTLTAALKWGVDLEILTRNAAQKVERPAWTPKSRAYTMEEVKRLHAVLEPPYGFLIGAAMWGGVRCGEAIALGRGKADLDRDGHRFYVRRQWNEKMQSFAQPKRNQQRWVPMLAPLEELLDAQLKWRPTIGRASKRPWNGGVYNLVTTNEKGEPLKAQDARLELQRLCKKAGVPYIGFVGLRHTYATIMRYMLPGMDLEISRTMGHKNVITFHGVYSDHADESRFDPMRLKVNAALSKLAAPEEQEEIG